VNPDALIRGYPARSIGGHDRRELSRRRTGRLEAEAENRFLTAGMCIICARTAEHCSTMCVGVYWRRARYKAERHEYAACHVEWRSSGRRRFRILPEQLSAHGFDYADAVVDC
jgi:hypothetical protein